MRANGESDSPFHIASILGISISDWDILAQHSGLFDASGRIQRAMWVRKLQLQVDFREFETTSTTGDRERPLWFRFLGLSRAGETQRTSRSSSMTSPGDAKATDTLVPSTSDDAVYRILQFHNRLDHWKVEQRLHFDYGRPGGV